MISHYGFENVVYSDIYKSVVYRFASFALFINDVTLTIYSGEWQLGGNQRINKYGS